MTSGLEYLVTNNNRTLLPPDLPYRRRQQWFYHNAPYLLIRCDRERKRYQLWEYTDQKIGSVIGLSGQWTQQATTMYTGAPHGTWPDGLLMLNQGAWAQTEVLADKVYFDQMTHPSQNRIHPTATLVAQASHPSFPWLVLP